MANTRTCSVGLAALALCLVAPSWGQTLPTLSQPMPDLVQPVNSTSVVIDLRVFFELPGVSNAVVQFDSNAGAFNFELLPWAAPVTVSNFVRYIESGRYTNSLVHRSDPDFVIQGGGISLVTNTLFDIPVFEPITNEFLLSNLRGTMAMARKSGQTNSATSQWFVNTGTNTVLDAMDGGFTVFARALGSSMDVVDTINHLPRANLGPPLTELPLLTNVVSASNLVVCSTITNVPIYPEAGAARSILHFTVSNQQVGGITALLTNSLLTLTFASDSAATTLLTVVVEDTHHHTTQDTFQVSLLSTFDFWKAEHFTAAQQTNRLVSGPDADPEGDHLLNVEEYVYALDPWATNASPLGVTHHAGGPTSAVALTFPRRVGLSDVALEAQTSSHYAMWSAAPAWEVSAVISGTVEWVTWALPGTAGAGARLLFTFSPAP